MKKICFTLAVLTLLACTVSMVFALGSEDEILQRFREEAMLPESEIMFESESYVTLNTKGQVVWRAPFAGIEEFVLPESFLNTKGSLQATGGTELIESELVYLDFNYYPSEKEAFKKLVTALMEEEDSDDLYEEWFGMHAELFTVYGAAGNKDENGLKDLLRKYYSNAGYETEVVDAYIDQLKIIPLGSAEDFTFYMVQNNEEDYDFLKDYGDGEYLTEFRELFADAESYVKNFTLMRPLGLTVIVEEGTGITFETTDVSGNPVKSADLFGKAQVTMINIWSTTCGFCISEMPDLMKINREYAGKGAQIIGIVYDATEEDVIAEARDIVEDLNIDFVNLLPTKEIKDTFQVQSFPCTYFVNSKGEILGDPVMGAAVSLYPQMIDSFLAQK